MRRFSQIMLGVVAGMGFITTGQAADLIVETPYVMEPGIVDVGGNWDGIYLGAFAGWAVGTADHIPDGGPCDTDDYDGCDVDLSGWLAGVEIGANFTVTDGIVAGVAADIAWADLSGEETYDFIGDVENSINWQGSVRGVLGFDGGAFLPYLTAGFAVANASHYSEFADFSADATHMGVTAGLGVAFAVTDNVAIDLQYRHTWYGEETYDMDLGDNNPVFDLETDQVTLGIRFMM